MFRSLPWQCLLLILTMVTDKAVADPFSGQFTAQVDGKTYRMTVSNINAALYEGVMLIDGEKMRLDARRFGEKIAGTVTGINGSLRFLADIGAGVPVFKFENGPRVVFQRSAEP